MSNVAINNYTYVKTDIVTNIKIELINLILFESASFRVLLFNDMNVIVNILVFILEGSDYKNWQNDDQFIIDWIKNQL